jgi:hypothetical protein
MNELFLLNICFESHKMKADDIALELDHSYVLTKPFTNILGCVRRKFKCFTGKS